MPNTVSNLSMGENTLQSCYYPFLPIGHKGQALWYIIANVDLQLIEELMPRIFVLLLNDSKGQRENITVGSY